MCAALFGLIAVCSTMALPALGGTDSTAPGVRRSRRKLVRSRKKFRYPFGAAATWRMPSSVPKALAISWEMARGALRRRRASSNATGVPRSPSSRFGGYSSEIDGRADSSSA